MIVTVLVQILRPALSTTLTTISIRTHTLDACRKVFKTKAVARAQAVLSNIVKAAGVRALSGKLPESASVRIIGCFNRLLTQVCALCVPSLVGTHRTTGTVKQLPPRSCIETWHQRGNKRERVSDYIFAKYLRTLSPPAPSHAALRFLMSPPRVGSSTHKAKRNGCSSAVSR